LLLATPAFAFSGLPASLVIGQPNFTSNTCATSQQGQCYPIGVAFDTSGNLWVADALNNRVLEYNAPFSTGEAASVVIGQPNFTANACATTSTGMCVPFVMTFDKSGNLWVADSSNARVLEYNAPFSTGEAASLVLGQTNFTTKTCATTRTGMCTPEAIAFDKSGNVWIGDNGTNRVTEYRAPFSNGEAASMVIGQPNFTSDTCATTRTGMCGPDGLAFDSSGNLLVADYFNYRVLEYRAPFLPYEPASLVIGQTSFTAKTCGAGRTAVCGPENIVLDRSGNLWVADVGPNILANPPVGNNRVVEFKAPFSTGEAASLVIGQPNFTANACATTRTGMCGPGDVAFDQRGNLWVADLYNSRVLEYP
jgi:sugar lactone lactonase YvrE